MDNISSHHSNNNNNKEAKILPPKIEKDFSPLKKNINKKGQGRNTSASFTISLHQKT
jgi:hypothetical protein